MLSRRQLLSTVGAVGVVPLAGCLPDDDLHMIELANETNGRRALTVEVFKVEGDGEREGAAPSADEIQERWRWLFYLQGDESRGVDSPARNDERYGGTYYVRGSTAEVENGIWTTSLKVVEIMVHQNELQMNTYPIE